jgi:2-polyprenyl-3-methyl-5-hydroxy-6-metoxy-1,4-benzoquinol methylase
MYQKNHYRRYEFALNNVEKDEICGDFACGTGYGSALISRKALQVIGADINKKVITEIKIRYKGNVKLEFINQNLLNLNYKECFSTIISFETIEHFIEEEIIILLGIFQRSLKENGKIVISTPYLQEDSEAARKLGFHKTFNIDEKRVSQWLKASKFQNPSFFYQDYNDHMITTSKKNPDFLICIANKE